MTTSINDLFQLFNKAKDASKKQLSVLTKLKNGQIDEAIHEVYNLDSFKKFLAGTYLSSAEDTNVFVEGKVLSMTAQAFPKDFQAKILNIFSNSQIDLIKGLTEFIGNPVEFDGNQLKTSSSDQAVLTKLNMMNTYLANNSSDIKVMQNINNSVSDEVYNCNETLEDWFNQHVLINPASIGDYYTVEF